MHRPPSEAPPSISDGEKVPPGEGKVPPGEGGQGVDKRVDPGGEANQEHIVEALCPSCRQPLTDGRPRQRRRRLIRQIHALQREILSLQQGALQSTIQRQTPAPACTICGQAAPGKPGQPTSVGDIVRPLQRRLDALEGELDQINRAG